MMFLILETCKMIIHKHSNKNQMLESKINITLTILISNKFTIKTKDNFKIIKTADNIFNRIT